MPSDIKGGRGRSAIVNWRVKCGNKEVYSDPVKFKCAYFIQTHKKDFDKKLKLIPPNY